MAQKIALIDTHCHIHDSEFAERFVKTQDELVSESLDAGIKKLICVGTDVKSSVEAIAFSKKHQSCKASIALHPHEAAGMTIEQIDNAMQRLEQCLREDNGDVVAIGECGLDYFYHEDDSVKKRQLYLLERHLKLAHQYKLPLIFHVRDPKDEPVDRVGSAYADFFVLFDRFSGLTGVMHSFSAREIELHGALSRGLYIGLNGIMTFSKQTDQLTAARLVPLEKLVLETDAPFLTPAPFRGTMCEPKHIYVTASFLSKLRGESLEQLAEATTRNAEQLFSLS